MPRATSLRCMFLPGDIVRCLDPGPTNIQLTRGKLYMVLDSYNGNPNEASVCLGQPAVLIRHDNGLEWWSFADRFDKE